MRESSPSATSASERHTSVTTVREFTMTERKRCSRRFVSMYANGNAVDAVTATSRCVALPMR
jgi:hypothetical protein